MVHHSVKYVRHGFTTSDLSTTHGSSRDCQNCLSERPISHFYIRSQMRSIIACTFFVCLAAVAHAGDTFVVNCNPLSVQRADPIVTPGRPAPHVHSIVGGNAFNRTMLGIDFAENATGTTCDK
ncbi:hypothetical protein PROFUN_16691, partial [Planoprotostelium fungivorum]